jgi:chorismate mutase
MDEKYYIINKNALPSVYEKVVMVKKLLYTGKCKTVNEAAKEAGISRSAFYKYKDDVSVYVDSSEAHILSLNLILSDQKGLLSSLLTLLSNYGASILTINQNIPFDDIAPVTVSLTTRELTCTPDELVEIISKVSGILKVEVIGKN